MTNKIDQSSAIVRQIPGYIRDQYPSFVDFLKLYYDFLKQTESQSLHTYKDIDTTLEEFIDRFKSELTANIPVNLASDKRSLMKNIREFYLARGSESSYKFLFRTLFGKEAELFYPSTQVLRVSDGKWQQDISIFVRVTGTTTDLFAIDGNFITITTPTKSIRTYVERVTQYSSNTFEVFIERASANEIEVGSTISVTVEEDEYTGVILACPNKVSVFRKGKGFQVGDRFSLNTSIGDGCVIKITRVDSEGGIMAIQVISFALDYNTTFWSYLSNKDIAGIEFAHPVSKNNTSPSPPYYKESYGGIIEYGFATKQTYMFEDASVNVSSAAISSDRYFVDASYVGDIVGEFYQEQVDKVLDEDLAIIQIELGAIAKYPGYYLSQDGFVSDEIYIQDGNYYQTYSYVIRVEEELSKYSNIIKSILHPAGMKMFAEYSIFSNLSVQTTIPYFPSVLQFSDTSIVTDGGTFTDGITTILSSFPILSSSKTIPDSVSLSFIVEKLIERAVEEETIILEESDILDFSKLASPDSVTTSETKFNFDFEKLTPETITSTDSIPLFNVGISSIFDSVTIPLELLNFDNTKSINLTQTVVDNLNFDKEISRTINLTQNVIDAVLVTRDSTAILDSASILDQETYSLTKSTIPETLGLLSAGVVMKNAYNEGDYFAVSQTQNYQDAAATIT